jgi:hypothetical protein
MPALGIVLILIAAVILWHIKMLHSAQTDASLVYAALPGRQTKATALDGITDPTLAAAVFLVALGHESPDDPDATRRRINHEIATIAPGAEDELIRYAEWASTLAGDSKDCIRRFKPLWAKRLSVVQRSKLVTMAEHVAAHRGIIDPQQKITLAALRLSLT